MAVGVGAAAAEDAPVRRRSPVSPYLVFSVLLVALSGVLAYRQPWGGDFGLHAAVVEVLRADLLHPRDPMVTEIADSPYFTPYTVVLGLIARVTGASGLVVLAVATPVVFAILLFGLGRFVRLFTPNRWAPILAVLTMFLLWGGIPPLWSGFLNFRGWPGTMPYPSTLAMGLTFLWWTVLWTALRRPAIGLWLGVGAAYGVIALIHQFTGVEAALGAIALAIGRARTEVKPSRVAVAVGTAALVLLAWPYYSVVEVMTSVAELDAIHRHLYVDLWQIYAIPLALCLPALVIRARRAWTDPLVWMVLLGGLVVAAGGLTGHWALGRAWPLVMISAQVALAIEVCAAISWAWTRRAVGVAVVTAIWLGLTVTAAVNGWQSQYNEVRVAPVDVRQAYTERLGWIGQHITPGDVLVTDNNWRARELLAWGTANVAPPWPDPTLPSLEQRRRDLAELTAPATPIARRRALLAEYQVRWILDTRSTWTWADSLALEIIDGPGRQRLIRLA